MSRALVVIGANFGDEGKGLLTDYLAQSDSVVVRFNGGAQAGHTVLTPDGQRHVFQHFGAGSLQGAATHLSRYFISNPLLFAQERRALTALGHKPLVSADPAGAVTTPYDMMLNQMVEEARGGARHGSCGIGINETIWRQRLGPAVSVAMLEKPADLRRTLATIRSDWLLARAAHHGISLTPAWRRRIDNDAVLEAFIEAAAGFAVTLVDDGDRLRGLADDRIVFEGAQGLLLDQDHAFFPHVTHSYTGLRNVIALTTLAQINALDVTYVTRAYVTRHGAGPLPHEQTELHYADTTNVVNNWQGRLRFAPLDLTLLGRTIQHDLRHAQNSRLQAQAAIALTHLDQVGDAIPVISRRGQAMTVSPIALSALLVPDATGLPVRYASFGPTRNDVVINDAVLPTL
jgi:adenylosuccinate synthase